MQNCKTPFSKRKAPRAMPLGSFFTPDKVPIAEALRQYQLALFEIDTLMNSTLRLREVELETVRAFMDKNGKAFQKAQKAALACDALDERARRLRKMKLRLFGDLSLLWGKYTGKPDDGPIIGYWVCKDYSVEKIAKLLKREPQEVADALYEFRNFILTLSRAHTMVNDKYKNKIVDIWSNYLRKEKQN